MVKNHEVNDCDNFIKNKAKKFFKSQKFGANFLTSNTNSVFYKLELNTYL